MPGAAHRRRSQATPIVTPCEPERDGDDNETERRRDPRYRATVSGQLKVSVGVPNFPSR